MAVANKTLLRSISEDRALGSSILFEHRHSHSTPPFHIRVNDLWRSSDQFVLIEAFRGGAKSTLAEEFLAMEGSFGNFFYALIIGETYAKACARLESIGYELSRNIKIAALFGKVLAKKPIENKIFLANGGLIEALGWEQEIRSFKHLDRRPDRALLDDIENLERVRSTAAVDATMQKIYRELIPAMDPARRKIRMIQTPLAADCAVVRIRQNPEWVVYSVPVCDGDIDDPKTKSNWPDRMPMEAIRRERDIYESAGMLKDFMQEYMLTVDTTEAKPFSEDMLRYADIAPGAAWLPRYVIYDPARTASMNTSDQTGKVVVSRLGSKIIVHESDGNFWKPDETRSDVFAANDRHQPARIGIEKNSLDAYLAQPLQFEMIRRGVSLPIEYLQAPQDRDKESFIMGLHPFFKAGDVLFVGGPSAHSKLIAQLKNFPAGKRDILNALAYAPRMFAGDPVYPDFSEFNVSPAPEPGNGEKVHAAWNASSSETVVVALIVRGRNIIISRSWNAFGPPSDAVKTLAMTLKSSFPRNPISSWVPAELHDQWQRIPLVPALRDVKLIPYRAEHIAVARGCLSDAIRMSIRNRRCLTVDSEARGVISALAGDYRYPIDKSGKAASEPQQCVSRMYAEAIECCAAMLAKGVADDQAKGANYATNAQGQRYMTSLPRGR